MKYRAKPLIDGSQPFIGAKRPFDEYDGFIDADSLAGFLTSNASLMHATPNASACFRPASAYDTPCPYAFALTIAMTLAGALGFSVSLMVDKL